MKYKLKKFFEKFTKKWEFRTNRAFGNSPKYVKNINQTDFCNSFLHFTQALETGRAIKRSSSISLPQYLQVP